LTYEEEKEREAARADLSEEEMAARTAKLRADKNTNLRVLASILEPYLLPHQMRAAADFAEALGNGVVVSSGTIYRLKTDEELEEEVVTRHMHERRERGSSGGK
jgi:hypothetical protein